MVRSGIAAQGHPVSLSAGKTFREESILTGPLFFASPLRPLAMNSARERKPDAMCSRPGEPAGVSGIREDVEAVEGLLLVVGELQ